MLHFDVFIYQARGHVCACAGDVDLHGCSCRAEVLQEVYAQHGARLPGQDSVQLTYEVIIFA